MADDVRTLEPKASRTSRCRSATVPARQVIGDDAVERGLAEGRAMDYDAMLAYAHADQ